MALLFFRDFSLMFFDNVFVLLVYANVLFYIDSRPASPGNPLSARGGYRKCAVSHFQSPMLFQGAFWLCFSPLFSLDICLFPFRTRAAPHLVSPRCPCGTL